ncbi:uncharacterized protein LOC110026210 [Phalaenopsis equestris]|uniref:uncharacterized protein LOC110026210 n=1 Tax=Phalaenopsis equestris TaxID=78828 RepID=UPI0009E3A55D|nr:uncharacterized protein LOC110026210 [Phalaenopsis equestris]
MIDLNEYRFNLIEWRLDLRSASLSDVPYRVGAENLVAGLRRKIEGGTWEKMLRDEDEDAPEELTSEQGLKQDEQIRKILRENKIRVAQQGKERRRQWAQRKIQSKSDKESVPVAEMEAPPIPEMLPSNIVDLLVAREKQTFPSDSEEEAAVNHKPTKSKKKRKSSGPETVLLEKIPPAQCLANSMDFLKRRKMKVSRSHSVLINARQALRLLSTPGNLLGRG